MRLLQLHLEDFRNYAVADLVFPPGVSAFSGPNGRGKTNILEAIEILATGGSFRCGDLRTLIRVGTASTRVRGTIDRHGQEMQLAVTLAVMERFVRKYAVDNAPSLLAKYRGSFVTVVFSPEDLRMITGEPGLRRAYMNAVAARTSPALSHHLGVYQDALMARNRLLKNIREGISGEDELISWESALIEHGLPILEARRALVERMEGSVPALYAELSGLKGRLSFEYRPTVEPGPDARRAWEQLYRDRRGRDIAMGMTTSGPQREDLGLFLDGNPLTSFGSRGEQRSAVLALKLTELDFATTDIGERPVLLLDDVLSELDHPHQHALLTHASEGQTILTTADEHVLEDLPLPVTILPLPPAAPALRPEDSTIR